MLTFTGSLADTSEDGVTTMVHGDVVNQLHDNDSLADTGTAEESNLTTLGVRSKKIDDLDARDKNLLGLALVSEERSRSVDGGLDVALNRSLLIDRLADDVQDAAKGARADRNHDRSAGINNLLTTGQTLGSLHTNGADSVLTQVLGNLKHKARGALWHGHLQGVEDRRKRAIELK
jgi:hypothetical protein